MERESESTCLGMVALFVILFLSVGVKAQTPTITNPTVSLTAIQADTVVTSVNCDMVRCPKYGLGALKAIVWSVTPVYAPHRVRSYLFVEFNGTALPIEMIPDAVDIDVVIADIVGGKAGHGYMVIVIYENFYQNQIYLQTFTLALNMPLTALSVGAPQQISSGSTSCSHPRIDMFAGGSNWISGSSVFVPPLNDYVATWMEDNGTNDDIIGALGTTNPSATILPHTIFTVEANAEYPDVAAFTSSSSGHDSAVFVYDSGYEVWNVTSTPTFGHGGSTSLTKTRVEAMNYQGTFTVNNTRWAAVGYEFNSPFYEVGVVNSLQSGYWVTPVLSGYLGNDQAYPVIAAGRGNQGVNYTGNHQYTIAWYDFGIEYDIYSQDVDLATGLPDVSTDFWKVSNSSFADPYINAAGTGSKNSSVAISSSSNNGDGILTAYFDGEYMVYKLSSAGFPGTYNFKPTRIQQIISKRLDVWPNPAADKINIADSQSSNYDILDMTGRTQLSGKLPASGEIDISSLAGGLYLIKLDDKGEQKMTNFVKQ
jgi:hypothetical protein